MAKRGVVYIVWGKGKSKRIDEGLRRSIQSVYKVHPGIGITVRELPDGANLLDKAKMYDLSPYDQTVYLDADTEVLDKLDFGFDMADRHAIVEAGDCRGKGAGRVALDEDPVRRLVGDDAVDGVDRARGEGVEVLAWHHQIEVFVGREAETGERRPDHVAMLARDEKLGFKSRFFAQCQNERRHLDRFRPGADDDEKLHSQPDRPYLPTPRQA